MRNVKLNSAIVFLSVVLLSGCTSEKEINQLNHELSSVKEQLKLSKEKVKVLEEEKAESALAGAPFQDPMQYQNDLAKQAITYTLITKNSTSNFESGEGLSLLHSLIFAEHITPNFYYLKKDTIEKTNPKIVKYFQIPDGSISNYFLHLQFSENIDLPIYVRNDSEQINTDEILMLIDPEKALPILYIKTDADLFNRYEVDVRGMRPYNPTTWIDPLVEHMELYNVE